MLIIAIVVIIRLNKLGNTTIGCNSGICSELDAERCIMCEAIILKVAKRLPTIIRVFIFFYILFLSLFAVNCYELIQDIIEGGENLFSINPIATCLQLLLEMTYCVTIFVAICKT